MNIYNNLPLEIQNKIKYYVLEHPTAKIIKDELQRLRCDEYYTFKDKIKRVFCRVDGRDHFLGEYFLRYKEDTYSDSSDEYMDQIFHRMFFVSSLSSEEDE